MIDGETSARLYREVVARNIRTASADTPEERAYRERIVKWMVDLYAQGKAPEMPEEEW